MSNEVRTEDHASYSSASAPAGSGGSNERQREIDDATIASALAILERRLAYVNQRGAPLTSPQATRDFLRLKMAEYPREHFGVLFLDTRHRAIAYEELFFGTIDSAHVHPREIVKAALRLNASAIIVAHNHPSGVAEPSQADLAITRRIRDACGLVDIRLLDHFIVGSTEVVSLAERGLV